MNDHPSISRRGLLRAGLATGVVAASSVLPIATVYGAGSANAPADPHAIHQAQQPATQTTPLGGFTYFNTFQAEIVNAAAGRLIPTDANGPGAIEAGVVFFIDQQLSASYGLVGRRYEHGPYAMGTSTQGDQSGMDMRDRYRLRWRRPRTNGARCARGRRASVLQPAAVAHDRRLLCRPDLQR